MFRSNPLYAGREGRGIIIIQLPRFRFKEDLTTEMNANIKVCQNVIKINPLVQLTVQGVYQ